MTPQWARRTGQEKATTTTRRHDTPQRQQALMRRRAEQKRTLCQTRMQQGDKNGIVVSWRRRRSRWKRRSQEKKLKRVNGKPSAEPFDPFLGGERGGEGGKGRKGRKKGRRFEWKVPRRTDRRRLLRQVKNCLTDKRQRLTDCCVIT